MQNGFLNRQTVKNLNFQNPRWRTAAISKKTVKSSYLSNRLNDFDEVWHGGAYCPPYRRQTVKMLNFLKTKMALVAILKNHKYRDITTTD